MITGEEMTASRAVFGGVRQEVTGSFNRRTGEKWC